MADEQKIEVSANALRQVLQALIGPSHLIRELQVIANMPRDNAIKTLVSEYNEQATSSDDGAA